MTCKWRINKFQIIVFTLGCLIGSSTVYAQGALPAFLTADVEEDLKIYVNKKSNYQFHKPESWHIYEIPNMSYTRVENFDVRTLHSLPKSEQDGYFKIEVVVFPRNDLTLEEWVDKQNTTSYPLPKILESHNMKVGGYDAIYQLEQYGNHVSPVIFISKGEDVYIINPSSDQSDYRSVINNFIRNFEFNSQ